MEKQQNWPQVKDRLTNEANREKVVDHTVVGVLAGLLVEPGGEHTHITASQLSTQRAALVKTLHWWTTRPIQVG